MSEHDEDRATAEGMPEKVERALAAAEEKTGEEHAFVRPEGLPFWCTALHLPQEDGGTLVLPAEGTLVPLADLEAIKEQAADSGHPLDTEVSD